MSRRSAARLPAIVAGVGVACSLLLGLVVQHTTRQLADARQHTHAELAADRIQLRARDIESQLGASARFLDAPGPLGVESFTAFAKESLAALDLVLGLWLVEGEAVAVTLQRPGLPALDVARFAQALRADPAGPDTLAMVAGEGRYLALVERVDGDRAIVALVALDRLLAPLSEATERDEPSRWSQALLADASGDVRAALALKPDAGPGVRRLWRPIALGEQVWRLHLEADEGGLLGGWHWEPLAMVFFGLGLTVLATANTQALNRRNREKAALAATLEAANQELRRRIEERDRFAQVLRDSERRYRDIYENALEGIFTTTPEGRFLSANPAMVRMLGYADEADLLAAIRNTATQLYVAAWRREEFVRLTEERGVVNDFEAEVRRKDGTHLWVSLSARAVTDASGRVVAYQGMAQDVTERRQVQDSLRAAKEQSDMASRAKSEFLANMSHELRTPLNAIIGFSEIIGGQALGPIENESYAEYARDIHDSGMLLLDLINDILDLSKIEAGKKELNERTVDVPRVVRSSMRLLRERALKGGVALETRMTDTLPPIRGDEVALKQILSNLLTNAVKFTPSGGSVTVGAELDTDGRLRLTVRDTGIGMAPEDIPKALEPFRQIEGSLSRNAGGAGLGLPLVQALVDLHGGEFRLDSAKGCGTVATVWLPADRTQLRPEAMLAALARR